MISLIKRDIINFFSKKKLNVIITILQILVSIYFTRTYGSKTYIDLILECTNRFGNFIYIIYRLIFMGYLLYLSYYIYMYDIKANPEYMCLRISKKKQIKCKYISIILINVLIHLTTFLICCIFSKTLYMYSGINIIITMFHHLLIEFIFLALLVYIEHYSIIFSLILYLIPVIFSYDINNNIYNFFSEVVIVFISYIINKKTILKLIEKEM